MSRELEAFDWMEKGDKKANSFGFFSSTSKYEDAITCYEKAANIFKLEKRWEEAGRAFCKAADMSIRAREKSEVPSKLVEASKMYKKCAPDEAIKCLKQAIEILVDGGRFHIAASHEKTIGELYETDLMDLAEAMKHYNIAAEWYAGEDSMGLASQCLLKSAQFAAQLEQYDKAIEGFERIGSLALQNSLTKYNAKEHLLKAGICHLCLADHVRSQKAIERYESMDVSFSTTRECQLLKDIMEAVETDDVQKFTNTVSSFDQLTRLDNWKTTMLLRIKKTMDEEPSLT